MHVFISWSGDRSGKLANALVPLLTGAIPGLEVWMSQQALQLGRSWLEALKQSLEESDLGVLCVTPENLSSAWLFFEAGAIAKNFSESRVVPYCLGVTSEDLMLPLAQFQGVEADRDGTWALVKTLNSSHQPSQDEGQLATEFNARWPDLASTIADLRAADNPGSVREIERERQRARAFCARVAGAWWERIDGEGIGFFQLHIDHLHNSVRIAGGRFYDEAGKFTARFNSAVARIEEDGGRKGIVYLRECQDPDRDGANWFHGYGNMWFDESAEAYDRGHGTFYDVRSDDPKQAVANSVSLWRAEHENDTIRTMNKGTPADQRALVNKMIDRLKP